MKTESTNVKKIECEGMEITNVLDKSVETVHHDKLYNYQIASSQAQ